MISMDKQYRTRDGQKVRIYAVDGEFLQEIHGAVCHNNKWTAVQWYGGGNYYTHGTPSCLDLIEVKPRIQREYWVNVYADGDKFGPYTIHEQRSIADNYAYNRIACVKGFIDCEEGEGL